MFVREKHYDNAIQKIRIDLGTELGLENPTDAHVTFCEPCERDVLLLQSATDNVSRLDLFRTLFENTLVEHDFYEIEGVKMSSESVIGLLYEKVDTTNKLIQEYSEAVFHIRTNEAEGR